MLKTTIIIPTYNEADNLARLVPTLFNLPVPDLNILVVDDGSPDGTGDLAEALSVEWNGREHCQCRHGQRALRVGLRAVRVEPTEV